jgi:hypothetical protein
VGIQSGGTILFKHDNARGLDDRYYGPGHLGLFQENGVDFASFHYYNPNGFYPNEAVGNKGGPTFGYGMLKWGEDGWPSISFDFIEEGFYTIDNIFSGKALDLEKQSLAVGTSIFQYAKDETKDTQIWHIAPLGTGEYTIRNYADTSKYLSVDAANPSRIRLTEGYTGSVNQKFRFVKTAQNKVIIYPTIKDEILDVPSATREDSYVRIAGNTNSDGQRWFLKLFETKLTASDESLTIGKGDSTVTIRVESNVYWSVALDDSSWVEVIFATGKKDGVIFLNFSANPNSESRETHVKLKARTGEVVEISIVQEGIFSNVLSTKNLSNDFTVFPNPTERFVNLGGNYPAEVRIYDQVGKLVLDSRVDQANRQLDLKGVQKGIYILQLKSSHETITQKLIIR